MRHFITRMSIIFIFIVVVWAWTQSDGSPALNAPVWNGITPSVTTRKEVISILGEPDETWQCVLPSDGLDLVRYEQECERASGVVHFGYYHERLPQKSYGWHEIQFNPDDTVDYIVEMVWPNHDPEIISVDEFLARYGRPERVIWSLREVRSRGLLYCKQGLILHAMMVRDKDVRIREVVYFAPMSTDECTNKFFNEVADTNPYEGGDLEGPEDPWGFNSDLIPIN